MRLVILLLALLLPLASPASAADDVAAAQGVIRAQEQALIHDDAAAAYSYAAPAIKEIFPEADIFMSMVRNSYAPVYRHKSFEFGEARARATGSRSASTSSTPMAKPGKRFTRWSGSRTAA